MTTIKIDGRALTRFAIAAVVAAVPMFALPVSTVSAAVPVRECGAKGTTVGGSYYVAYAVNITTRKVPCSRARNYATSFLKQSVIHACEEGWQHQCYFRNYVCRMRYIGRGPDKPDFRCVRGQWVIRWQAEYEH